MENTRKRAAVILAAGKSTRMMSARSKVLHEVGGLSMLAWVARLARTVGVDKIVTVVNAGRSDVRDEAERLGLEIAIQEPQLGTGHAVLAAKEHLADFDGDMVVLYADTPLIQTETLVGIFNTLDDFAHVAVLGFEPEDPGAYGRLIVEGGRLMKIVEAKDASDKELAVRLCNSGVMAASCENMFGALSKVTNENAKGEYYLTDVVGILRNEGKIAAVVTADATEVLGVNSRRDLAHAEQAFQNRARLEMMQLGVTLRDPDSIYFSHDTQIAADVQVGANVVFGPGVSIETGAIIHPFCHIEGAHIGTGRANWPLCKAASRHQYGRRVQGWVTLSRLKNLLSVRAARLTIFPILATQRLQAA